MPTIKETIVSWSMEDRILQVSTAAGIVSVFLPWIGGEWLGEAGMSYSGFEFFTGFIGFAVFLLFAAAFLIGLYPAMSQSNISQRRLDVLRLIAVTQATTLLLGALSVLTIITYEYARMNIQYGIYVALFSCLVSCLYAYWELESHKRVRPRRVKTRVPDPVEPISEHLPPPPPPPQAPEEHVRHR